MSVSPRSPNRVFRDLFEKYDLDGNGEIRKEEFVDGLLPDLGIEHASEDEIDRILGEIDEDGNGVVDFEEFVTLCQLLQSTAGAGKQQGVAGLVKAIQISKQQAKDAFLTERQKIARQKIHSMLYHLPCFAPDFIYRRWWDVVILTITLYLFISSTIASLLIIPPSVGYIASEMCVSFFLVVDVGINLNTAFQAEDSPVLEVNRMKIFLNYLLSGNLLLDVVSAVPLGIFLRGVVGMNAYRFLVLLRCAKVLKVPSLFPLMNRGTMDQAFVRFYFWTVPVLRFLFKLVSFGHVLTMVRLSISLSHPDENCEILSRDACTQNAWEKYFYSFFWVWSMLTTQGTVHLHDMQSFLYAAVIMLVSLFLQGHIVARMSGEILQSNVEAKNHEIMICTLATMKHYSVPMNLQNEVLSFQYYSLRQNATLMMSAIFEHLPPSMQTEVALYIKVESVTKVPMFQDLSAECKLAVASCLRQLFAEPNLTIIEAGEEGSAMYFMMHGYANVILPNGSIVAAVSRGDIFGEIALLIPEQKRTATILALSYCSLFRLDYPDLQGLFIKFPELHSVLEHEAESRGLRSTEKLRERKHKYSISGTLEDILSEQEEEAAEEEEEEVAEEVKNEAKPVSVEEPQEDLKVELFLKARFSAMATHYERTVEDFQLQIKTELQAYRKKIDMVERRMVDMLVQVEGCSMKPRCGSEPTIPAATMAGRFSVFSSFVAFDAG